MESNRDPALSLSNSRLVRIYKDTKRPMQPTHGRGSKCDHVESLKRTQAGGNVLDKAGHSQHPQCGARRVHIEISDTAAIKHTRDREEIAFDEAECWSQSEEDEGSINIEKSPPPAQTKQQTVSYGIHTNQSRVAGKSGPIAENSCWLNTLPEETFDNTVTRSSSIVFNFDKNYLAEDSEDEFKEVPTETDIFKKKKKQKKKKIPYHLFD